MWKAGFLMDFSIDNSDRAILRELQTDASISNLELSKKIGLSPSACLTRTKNLKEAGIIKQFTTIVDERKLGLEMQAFALVNLVSMKPDMIEIFINDVTRCPQIQECYTLTGSHDYLLKIISRDTQSYRDFVINYLTANAAVDSVETLVILGVEKRTTTIPVEMVEKIKGEK